MREANWVAVILVAALLLFGCGAPAQKNETNQTPPAQPPSQPPSQPPAEQPPSAPPSQPPSQAPPPSGTYSGMDWAALVALGVPLECDVTNTVNQTTTRSHIYMKGTSEMRIESPTNNPSGCQTIVIIPKSKSMYMGCKDGQFIPQCDWVYFELSGESNGTMTGQVTTTGGGSVTTDFNDTSSSQIDCKAWVYDASKFTTDGKVCDLNNLGG